MYKILTLSLYETRQMFRNIRGIAIALLLPILMFLIFSNLLSKAFNPTTNISIVEYLVPAFIPIIIINAVLVVFGQQYILYKEQGNLLKYKLLGMNNFQVAISIFFSTFLLQLVAIALLVVSSNLTKGIRIPWENTASIMMGIVLINLFQFALSFFFISIINKSITYQPISLVLFYYQMFLGGLTFPPEMFPDTLKKIVYVTNPVVYGLEIMRGVWTAGKSIFSFGKQILILLIASFLLISIAIIIEKLRQKRFSGRRVNC